MKYPIGPKTQAKAKETKSGQLAGALSYIIYDSCHDNGKWKAPSQCRLREIEIKGLTKVTPDKYDTEAVLREIRDHLEFLAFREVTE